ncbi:IclR family transcriptional regulator [Amycolatopsis sp. FDAARGOS 1241]|uniref:IclR family transcriptional regulator n=1 Tax=Amycolatopsis sp. FDAARGOS 1241 TaxID=2778070 RepID=UPI001952388D|nr:IclR family transcriptional regulator [Amycolatopsis sp. FDAARGOS 1241]QRP43117.1 IclR family transcriptional regulator [Amycolatopsis sp. FDAARGOS 1241]
MTSSQSSAGLPVPSVARAAHILDALAAAPDGLPLSELARVIGAPKSSCLAVCTTLVATGLLVRTPGGQYQLGWKVVPLGRAYLSTSGFVKEFRRVDQELGLLSEDTIVLSLLDGRNVVYVETRPGLRTLAMSYEIGMRLPAHCTAGGKSLLASLPDTEIAGRYADGRFETPTPRSISRMPELMAEITRTRANGYAIDDEETAPGMMCVGAAVAGRGGHPVGALSVSMVKSTVDAHRLDHSTAAILRLSTAITERLGGL